MKFSPRQRKFVAEYLADPKHEGKAAAIAAGYSRKGADVQAHKLLAMKHVAAAVDKALRQQEARLEVKSDDILRELMRVGLCDVGLAFDASGRPLPIKDMPEELRRAISGIEVTSEVLDDGEVTKVTKIKFWDKVRSLELLGKHLKLFADRIEHTGTVTLEQLVMGSEEKPK